MDRDRRGNSAPCEHLDVLDVDARALEAVVERALGTKPVELGRWSPEEIFAVTARGLACFA
jgi:hypothetical protein